MAERLSNYVNGKWVAASTAEFHPVYNPATGKCIAETPLCGEREVGRRSQRPARPTRIGGVRRLSSERAISLRSSIFSRRTSRS